MSPHLEGSQLIWDGSAPSSAYSSQDGSGGPVKPSDEYAYHDDGTGNTLVPISEVDLSEPPPCGKSGPGHSVQTCLACSRRVRWVRRTLDSEPRQGTGAEPPRSNTPLCWAEVMDGDPEPEDWLIWPLVERGKSVSLYSLAKAGKSLLVLELVAAAVAGKPALGRPGRGPIRVLYLDQENTAVDLRERLEAMDVRPEELDGLVYLSFPAIEPLTTARGGAALAALAEEHRPDLIVLDTVSRFIDGPENDSDTWHALELHTLRGLKRAGIAVLRLDHAGKEVERGERGSSAKNSDVDASWSLTHETQRGTRTLTRRITRNGHGPTTVLLSIEAGPLRHTPTGGTGEHPVDAAERLLDELDGPEREGVNAAYERVKEAAKKAGTKPPLRQTVQEAQKRRQERGGDPA
ncbi:AAA family ATPase [Brachybacterium paraconglomeratum]|uniref:AAA family ATPase n=1 Tax=Brachybacterium paraconglomeratum TaxID=173362 RepID=UPI00248FFB30|nr:AAA family ATPase [Brachybacterium paraconglomeratum]